MVQIPKTVDGGVTSNLGRLAQLLLVSPTREVLPLRGFCEGRESGMLAQVLVITRSDKQSNGTGGIAAHPLWEWRTQTIMKGTRRFTKRRSHIEVGDRIRAAAIIIDSYREYNSVRRKRNQVL